MDKILKLVVLAAIFVSLVGQFNIVYAQVEPIKVEGDSDLGIGSFELPTFFSIERASNFSIISYVALGINIVFGFIVITWIFLAVRAAADWMRSEGDSGMIEGSRSRFGNVFASISILFGFFIVLILVSNFFGFGSFVSWPKQFSICNLGENEGKYYFSVALENKGYDDFRVDEVCFK